MQSFTAPKDGTYKLEVWGAQGGGGVGGGYSYGDMKLIRNTIIYMCIGGAGLININGDSYVSDTRTAGYNGGGYGQCGGGGATHISTTNRGVLSNYVSFQGDILIVAGGSGGGDGVNPGSGGGLNGGNSGSGAGGGTQTTGGTGIGSGTFGQGGNIGTTNNDSAGAGGGGWYGGGSSTQPTGGAGGGGSGHINTNYITNGTMANGVQGGNGYAVITKITF